MDSFLNKNKIQQHLAGKCDTNQKQKRHVISEKKDYSVRHFKSVLTIS